MHYLIQEPCWIKYEKIAHCTFLCTFSAFHYMFYIFLSGCNSRTIQDIKFKFSTFLRLVEATTCEISKCTGFKIGIFRICPIVFNDPQNGNVQPSSGTRCPSRSEGLIVWATKEDTVKTAQNLMHDFTSPMWLISFMAGCGSSIGRASAWHADSCMLDPHIWQHSFVATGHEIISTAIQSRRFKKNSCQLLVKECALSTRKLPRRLAREQWE